MQSENRSLPPLAAMFLTLGLLVATGLRSSAVTVTWTNTNGGLWGAPLNWDTHFVPRSTDDVVITADGIYTVTVDTNGYGISLTLGGTSGAQSLTNASQILAVTNVVVNSNGNLGIGVGVLMGTAVTNSGVMNWGGGTCWIAVNNGPSGLTRISGGINLQGALINRGTVSWTGGTVTVANNAGVYSGRIDNQAGGVFSLQSDQYANTAGYGFEFFRNNGTVTKIAAVGASTFAIGFTNNGLVDVQSGTISFSGNGTISGTYNTASNTIIQFVSGNYVESGSVTNSGSGTFRQYGANVTLNDRIPKFILASGNVALSPTFQGSGSIQNLQLDGAYLTGSNRITGTLGINGGGLNGASPLTVEAGGILAFNGAGVTLNAAITNLGTIDWSGAYLTLDNNGGSYTGAIYNQPGGLFNLQSDTVLSSGGYGQEIFRNEGTFRKSAGLGNSYVTVPFINAGTVDCQSGNIQFNNGGNLGAVYNAASGSTIQFTGGTYTEASTNVTITGAGKVFQYGANVTLNDRIPSFALTSGNVILSPGFQGGSIQNLQLDGANLTGTNEVTGVLLLNGGGIPAGSPLTVAPSGTLTVFGNGMNIYSPLTNLGTINSGATVGIANNQGSYTGAVYNQPGAFFNLQSDVGVLTAGYGSEFFYNAGTFQKVAGVGTSGINVNYTNAGIIQALSGSIQFYGGGNIGGSYNTSPGTFVQLASGNYVENGSTVVSGGGLFRQNGATVTLNSRINGLILASGNVILSPTFQGSGGIQDLQLDGAILTGAHVVTGTLGFNGGGNASASPLTIQPGGTLKLNGVGVQILAPLTNLGAILWTSGGLTIANNASSYTGTLYNGPGSTFWIQCDQSLISSGYGFESINNVGTFKKTAGLGQTSIGVAFGNSGTLDVQAGTIRITGPYTQTGGAMNFGITSLAYYGQVSFATVAPLTGNVSLNFNGSYFPNAGDTFNLVTYGSRAGTFTGTTFPSQAQWQTNYSASTFSVSVLSASSISPVTITPLSLASGKFSLQVNGSVGPQYVLLASTDLNNWISLYTNSPVAAPFSMVDSNAGDFGRRFYRLLVQ